MTKSSSSEATFTSAHFATSGSLLRSSSGSHAAVAEERAPLADNIKYKIKVYNAAGDYVTEKTYTNSVDNTAEIALDAAQIYTFVAYSIYCSSSRGNSTGRFGEC